MKKIELSAEEIKVIKQQLNGEIELWTATEEQQKYLSIVIDKALDLREEMGRPSVPDIIKWYYDLYLEQQTNE